MIRRSGSRRSSRARRRRRRRSAGRCGDPPPLFRTPSIHPLLFTHPPSAVPSLSLAHSPHSASVRRLPLGSPSPQCWHVRQRDTIAPLPGRVPRRFREGCVTRLRLSQAQARVGGRGGAAADGRQRWRRSRSTPSRNRLGTFSELSLDRQAGADRCGRRRDSPERLRAAVPRLATAAARTRSETNLERSSNIACAAREARAGVCAMLVRRPLALRV